VTPPLVAYGGNNTTGPIEVATARNAAHSTGRLDFESETFLVQEAPLVFESRFARNGRGAPEALVPPLKAESGQTGKGDSAPLVLQAPELADPISASEGRTYTHEGSGNFRLHNVVPVPAAYRKAQKAHDPEDCERWEEDTLVDPLPANRAMTAEMIAAASAVRRLTPVECERLQGFPDGWTCLCQPLEAYAADADAAALACRCADSARYRALGNAVTVTVVSELGARLRQQVGA